MTSEILKSDNYSELHFNPCIQILFIKKKDWVFYISKQSCQGYHVFSQILLSSHFTQVVCTHYVYIF